MIHLASTLHHHLLTVAPVGGGVKPISKGRHQSWSYMKHLVINRYLVDTVVKPEHPAALEMKLLLEDMAKEYGGEAKNFEIMKPGVASVGISTDEALQKIQEEFKAMPNVDVSIVSHAQIQLERNRERQRMVDAKRATKAAHKKPEEVGKK